MQPPCLVNQLLEGRQILFLLTDHAYRTSKGVEEEEEIEEEPQIDDHQRRPTDRQVAYIRRHDTYLIRP